MAIILCLSGTTIPQVARTGIPMYIIATALTRHSGSQDKHLSLTQSHRGSGGSDGADHPETKVLEEVSSE